jgi:hypothetical protein
MMLSARHVDAPLADPAAATAQARRQNGHVRAGSGLAAPDRSLHLGSSISLAGCDSSVDGARWSGCSQTSTDRVRVLR